MSNHMRKKRRRLDNQPTKHRPTAAQIQYAHSMMRGKSSAKHANLNKGV